jgi:PAS domain S-box-containing protein
MNRIAASEWELLRSPQFQLGMLETLLKQMPSGVLVAEAPGGRVVYVNPQLEAALGSPVEEWAENPTGFWRGFHPDGRPYAVEDWPLHRVLHGGSAVPEEDIEVLRVDGSRAVFRVSACPLRGEDGTLRAAILICHDITEDWRRFSSGKFLNDAAALLASSEDYLATLRTLARVAVPTLADWCTIDLLDEEGRIERVAVEHIDRRKAAAASALARRYPPDIRDGGGVAPVIRSGESSLIPEVTVDLLRGVARSGGHLKILKELGISSLMIVPLKASGKVMGAITFVSAESGRRYTPDDLEVAEQLASRAALAIENSRLQTESQAATEAKSDFLAVMSHELRTPLTAIIGYAELLQLGVPEPVTPGQKEQAERIEISARSLLQLIEEILTLVTLDTGEARMREEEMRVNALLDEAASIVEPMARVKGLPIEVVHAEGDPVLHSDPEKLLQILLNLLSNAVKFTESGTIRLVGSATGGIAEIEVADTGIGLEPEHQRRIFEPFWQVERPITRRAGGTGLGLTISRRLADLLGGEIRVDSQPGAGSRFIVRVPLAKDVTLMSGGTGQSVYDRGAQRRGGSST